MKRQKNFLVTLLVLSMLVLSTLACSFSGVTLGKGNAEVTVNLQEKGINELLQNTTNHIGAEDILLSEITRVDLQNGMIRVFGIYTKPDGSDAEGSYDLALSAENGRIKAQITGADIEGVSLGDARVQRVNDELQKGLEESYQDSHGEVEFQSIQVTEDAVKFVIKTDWNQ